MTAVDDAVHVDTERERLESSPTYEPELVLDRPTAAGFYDHFGFAPYWTVEAGPDRARDE